SLEEYVEEFLNACHLASCDDVCLMEGFWCGLDDDIRFVMPREDPLWTLKDYINFTLWVGGSTLTVDEADAVGDINIQPHLADPEPSQPSPQFAEHEPEPTVDGEPEPSVTDEPLTSGVSELRTIKYGTPHLTLSPPSVRWARRGSASLHRRHGWRIPHLRLQPHSPGLCLGPSTQRLHPGSHLPCFHHHPSVHQLHRAPSSLRLRL
ncbi:hypothetical protein M9458_054210, partial [Cirrhinus mrigala]